MGSLSPAPCLARCPHHRMRHWREIYQFAKLQQSLRFFLRVLIVIGCLQVQDVNGFELLRVAALDV